MAAAAAVAQLAAFSNAAAAAGGGGGSNHAATAENILDLSSKLLASQQQHHVSHSTSLAFMNFVLKYLMEFQGECMHCSFSTAISTDVLTAYANDAKVCLYA